MPHPRIRGLDNGERAALVISECQTAIVDPTIALFPGLGQQVAMRGMLERIAALADACRVRNIPVIHCTVKLLPDAYGFAVSSPLQAMMRRSPFLCADCPESGIHPILATQGNDIVCDRRHGITGFHGTDLEAILRGLDTKTIILAGVSTDIAIVGMSIEAVNRGFSVVIPEDCTAGGSSETHLHAIRHVLPILSNITASADIIRSWN